jgi:hypothetical protein
VKLTYETGTATLIQLIVLGLLKIATGISSTVHACRSDSDCLGSVLINFIFYVVLVGWFLFLCVLGFAAQQKRSRRLAQLLIAAEGLVALVALFDAKHHNNTLELITSVVDFVLAIWVISLAYRLMKSGGGRVVVQRARKRKRAL